jgi:hypothetical protein
VRVGRHARTIPLPSPAPRAGGRTPPRHPEALTAQPWPFLRSTTLQRLGRLTLREDAWRLPTGQEGRSPPDLLAADDDEFFERRVVPFAEAVGMAIENEITQSVSKVALLAALRRGARP